MLAADDIVAFIATADARRARAFYEAALGLRLVEDTSFAQVFDANGIMLRVTPVPDHKPLPHTVLGWRVPNIEATARHLVEKGVVFERFPNLNQDMLGIWTSPDGNLVTWFKDPDGNLLSLTQFASP